MEWGKRMTSLLNWNQETGTYNPTKTPIIADRSPLSSAMYALTNKEDVLKFAHTVLDAFRSQGITFVMLNVKRDKEAVWQDVMARQVVDDQRADLDEANRAHFDRVWNTYATQFPFDDTITDLTVEGMGAVVRSIE